MIDILVGAKTKKIGLILCACKYYRSTHESLLEVASWLRNEHPDIIIEMSKRLCDDPRKIRVLVQKRSIERVIIGACGRHSEIFLEEAQRARLKPFSTRVFELLERCLEFPSGDESLERAKLLLSSAISGERFLAGSPEGEIYMTLLPKRRSMNRRAFLKLPTLLHPRIVPKIESEFCTTNRGCEICIKECPRKAMHRKYQSVRVEYSKCGGCGSCAVSCPNRAIFLPQNSLEKISSEVRVLTRANPDVLNPRILLFVCEGSKKLFDQLMFRGFSYPPNILAVNVPCMASLKPYMYLRSFELGAQAVGLIHCQEGCEHDFKLDSMHRDIELTKEILKFLGMEPERILPIEAGDASEIQRQLILLNEKVTRLGNSVFRDGWVPPSDMKDTNLLKLVNRISKRCSPQPVKIAKHPLFPFLTINVNQDACTFCGLCALRCPTEALSIKQDSSNTSLIFDYSLCVACNGCLNICPAKALIKEEVLEIGRVESSTSVLARDRLAMCKKCGEAFMPLKYISKLTDMSSNMYGQLISRYCTQCRARELNR
jgi:ferredoxin